MTKPVLGCIGMGIMGLPMTLNWLNAGYSVHVWNRTKAKTEQAINAGAIWTESPNALAALSDVIITNVTDTPDVESVVFGEDGAAHGMKTQSVLVDHSTISPGLTREFSAKLSSQFQCEWLDAPVSGGDVGAKAGTLSVMVGGSKQVFDRCVPLFEVVGKTVTYVGPSGAGQACKACNQILCAVNLMAVCESMALAVKEGLDLKTMLQVTGAGAGGSWALNNLGHQISDGDMQPGFMVDYLLKDLGIVFKALDRHGMKEQLAALEHAHRVLETISQAGGGKLGTQAASQVYEMLLDLKYTELN